MKGRIALAVAFFFLLMARAYAATSCSYNGVQVLRVIPPPNHGDTITTDDYHIYYEVNGLWAKEMIDGGHTIQITTTHLTDLEGDRCIGGNLDSADVDPQIYQINATNIKNPYGTWVLPVWYQHVERYNPSTGCYTSGEHIFTIYLLVDGSVACTMQYSYTAHSPTVQASVIWNSPSQGATYLFPSPLNDADIHLDASISVTQGGSGKICVIWQKNEGSWVDKSLQASFYAQNGTYPIDATTSLRSITSDWEGEWRVAVYYTPSSSCTDSQRVLLDAVAFTAGVDYGTYTPPPSTCGSYSWSSPEHDATYVENSDVPISISIPGDEFDLYGQTKYAYRIMLYRQNGTNWDLVQTWDIQKPYSWQTPVTLSTTVNLGAGEYKFTLEKYAMSSGESASCEARYIHVSVVQDVNYTWIEPKQNGYYEFNQGESTYFPFKINGTYTLSSGELCWRWKEIDDTSWSVYSQTYSGSGSFDIDTNIPAQEGIYTMQFYISSDGCANPDTILEDRTFTVAIYVPPPPPEQNQPTEENVPTGPVEMPIPPTDAGESAITGYAVFAPNVIWYLVGLGSTAFLAPVDIPLALSAFSIWNYAGIRSGILDLETFWEAVALPLVISMLIIARRLNILSGG